MTTDCPTCNNSGFSGYGTGYDAVCSDCGGQSAYAAQDVVWRHMVTTAVQIRNRIVAAGEMATKTRVEDELMPMFGIDRGDAHSIMNHIEYHCLRVDWQR